MFLRTINAKDLAQRNKIGEGVYAEVYKVKFSRRTNKVPYGLETDTFYAEKESPIISDRSLENDAINLKKIQSQLKEMSVLFESNHPNVMRGLSAYYLHKQRENGKRLNVVMDLADGALNATDKRYKTWDMAAQLIFGLNHLHSNGIAHLDLKFDNVLTFNGPGSRVTPKITDFGISLVYERPDQLIDAYRGVFGWTAPSVVIGPQTNTFGFADDVYTLGLMIWRVLGSGEIVDEITDGRRKIQRTLIDTIIEDREEEITQKVIEKTIDYNTSGLINYLSSFVYDIEAQEKEFKKLVSKFLYKHFLNEDASKRSTLKDVINSKDFEKLCEKYSSYISKEDILTEQTPFKCLVPEKPLYPLSKKQRDAILETWAETDKRDIVMIYAIDLFDRVSSSIRDKDYDYEYLMNACVYIIENILEEDMIEEDDNLDIHLVRFSVFNDVINATHGTFYRPLISFLNSSYPQDKLYDMIMERPITDIINKGCKN